MAAPVLQAHTMRRGALTKASAGGVPLAQFMVVSGTGITSWSITLAGGTSGHWNLPTDGTSPTPTSAGDTANLNGGPYTFNVTATNADGTSNSVVLTINIAANTYTVATNAQVDSGLRLGTESGLSIRSQLGGRTVEYARGCDPFASTWRGFNIHAGTFTVTSEDTTNRTLLTRLINNGGCSRIIFTAIDLLLVTAAYGPDVGQPPGGSNVQNTAMLQVAYNATFGVCTDLTFTDLDLGSGEDAIYASQWMSGIDIAGSGTIPATGIVCQNLRLTRVKDGLRVSKANNCTFEDITIDRFCSNSAFIGGFAGNTFRNILYVRPTVNRADPGDHRDYNQCGQPLAGAVPAGPGGNYENYTFERIYCINADGTSASQGPFFDDVSVYLQAATGYYQNGHTLRNIFYDGCVSQGIHMDGGAGWLVQMATIVRGSCAEAVNVDSSGNIVPATFIIPQVDGSGLVSTTGVVSKCAIQTISSNVKTGGFPDITTLNSELGQMVALPPGNAGFTSQNEALRAAYYENFFQDPGRVVDYANLTAAQILAEIREMYAPIQGGLLMNPDGTYNGAFFPDGTDNDGTVFGGVAPTSYTLTVPQTPTVVGTPVTATVQLNAPADAQTQIDPSVSGTTGSFSPDPIVLEIGEITATTDFTPTSAGTATISTTNNQGLTDPAAVQVTVAAASDPPTAIAQAATPQTVPLSLSVVINYTLDHAAIGPVTITAACSLAGSFSGNPVVIGSGETVGSVTFVPSAAGTASFTCTNDGGLANPAAVEVTVTACSAAQLIALGVR